MTLEEQFKAARDITPHCGMKTVVRDGKTVNIPLLYDGPDALFISEDQGEVIDEDGSRWLVGTQGGEIVKWRIA